MLKALPVIGLFLLVLACSSGEEESAAAPHKNLEFFNPYYVMPEADRVQSCVVDAVFDDMPEDAFIAALDRIIEHTEYGILYSDMTRRDRVIYVAPVVCDLVSGKAQYSAGAYFESVRSETHKPAADYPFIVNDPELVYDNLIADLDNAAFAVDLTFPEPAGDEESLAYYEKFICVLDDSVILQREYGLPLIHVSLQSDALQYFYNMEPDNRDLVVWLTEHGLRACGENNQYTVRALNEKEQALAAAIFVERK